MVETDKLKWDFDRIKQGASTAAKVYPVYIVGYNLTDGFSRWTVKYDSCYLKRKKNKKYTQPVVEMIFANGGWEFEESVKPVVNLSGRTVLSYLTHFGSPNLQKDYIVYAADIYGHVRDPYNHVDSDNFDKVYTARKRNKALKKPFVRYIVRELGLDLS